jgi:hypothetical protein
MVSEHSRFQLSKDSAGPLLSNIDLMAKTTTEESCILRYVFNPSQEISTHHGQSMPRMTWTKPSSAANSLGKLLQGQKKPNQKDTEADAVSGHNQSMSNTSSDTWPSHLSTTTPPTTESRSSMTSGEYPMTEVATQVEEGGLIIDADREVQFKILIGRSGATRSKLPDMLSAGYLWFIPAFETPIVKGKTQPKKGQVVQCQFGVGEIDFRKGKKAAPLMGGGDIRSITVEFEWVEVGWHEDDDVDTDGE